MRRSGSPSAEKMRRSGLHGSPETATDSPTQEQISLFQRAPRSHDFTDTHRSQNGPPDTKSPSVQKRGSMSWGEVVGDDADRAGRAWNGATRAGGGDNRESNTTDMDSKVAVHHAVSSLELSKVRQAQHKSYEEFDLPGVVGVVGDFGRFTLPEWTSRRVATQCAVGQVTSALLHSACIAEVACTVWAEAHATENEL